MSPDLVHDIRAAVEIDATGPKTLTGLTPAALAYVLAHNWPRAGRSMIVVAPDVKQAEQLASDLNFFLGMTDDDQAGVILFPPYEFSRFGALSPPAEVSGLRVAALYRLATADGPSLVVTTVAALLARLMPKGELTSNVDYIETGQETDRDQLLETLRRAAYFPTSLVEERGDFARRGAVVDVYPPLSDWPVRIEFLGDTVESIRLFDGLTQRSRTRLEELTVLPAREVILGDDNLRRAEKTIAEIGAEIGLSALRSNDLMDKIGSGLPFDGIESLLPAFYKSTDGLFDYLPQETEVVLVEPEAVYGVLEDWPDKTEAEFERQRDLGHFALPPGRLFFEPVEIIGKLEAGLTYSVTSLAVDGEDGGVIDFRARPLSGLREKLYGKRSETSLLAPLVRQIKDWHLDGRRTVMVVGDPGRARKLAELLEPHNLETRIAPPPGLPGRPGVLTLTDGLLSAGFSLPGLTLLTEDEVFGRTRKAHARVKRPAAEVLDTFDELEVGDAVVHDDHGIGRYRGLVRLEPGGPMDFLEIEYAAGDRLYLPVDRLHLLSRYQGMDDRPVKLDRLGGATWQKTKERVRKAVERIAQDLVELYALRQIKPGFGFTPPDSDFREFEAAFPYHETSDQEKAIGDVIADMLKERPMDRLVCGDVGFGKTEVALRAAFKAVTDQKQVAVLVPTTVLAEQHYRTFTARFEPYPVLIEVLSRFRTPKVQKRILERTAAGRLDVVIGTHRLLQKDVVFKELGLVIVDEEHRFGVRHKEKLKKLRRQVDVLTLTATPIPRTMHMSMSGVRDLSVINTPPDGRLAVKTYLSRFTPEVIVEAVRRELDRGGQVFFVHDRVHNIGAIGRYLQKLLPGVRFGLAHGQMSERALETGMHRFLQREIDVLICTTIIESGLDIPNANTIIINQAHRFGLAQIYQLRGRVGRGAVRAYAYLLIPSKAGLTKDARKRLKVLMDFSELGSGFKIAMHDLKIRGAGNMLGSAQTGQVNAVGYELYVSMLEREIRRLKGETVVLDIDPEIRLPFQARIPEAYISHTDIRLNLYRRLSAAADPGELGRIGGEIADRFGPPPEDVSNLIEAVELKLMLKRHRVTKAALSSRSVSLTFADDGTAPVEAIMDLVAGGVTGVSLHPDGTLKLASAPGDKSPIETTRNFLKLLPGPANVVNLGNHEPGSAGKP